MVSRLSRLQAEAQVRGRVCPNPPRLPWPAPSGSLARNPHPLARNPHPLARNPHLRASGDRPRQGLGRGVVRAGAAGSVALVSDLGRGLGWAQEGHGPGGLGPALPSGPARAEAELLDMARPPLAR